MLKPVMSLLALCLSVCPVAAQEKPPLRDVEEISQPLFAIAMAKEVSDHCDSLGARFMKGLGALRRLRDRANALGYTDSEIRAFIESDAEKARMRSKGEHILAQKGASLDAPETICAYGRAEIEKNSAIGAFLRAK